MLKSKLLATIAGKNRGISATPTDRQAILAAITELELRNPNPRPLTTAIDFLAGNWRLLYTSSQSLLSIDKFPLVKLGDIYQCIRPTTSAVYNIAEVTSLLPGLDGLVAIVAKFTPVNECRVNVRFNRSVIGLQRFIDYSNPDTLIDSIENGRKFTAIDLPINRPEDKAPAWLEVTYLDETLRISRGNEGSVFVLTK
ncbi:PAP/fibrillin family protein [Chamaesiphon minutus]|uniref:PAP_fibrillin n=1 Tax=Chamaesiphon minutus (strain ATCC 27169 / PCC 6605) TaxID=1173020 RepID=K9UB00_CHAP6|nr:PAP/fibrillin family protein [Chamaesiphon minutus]AFY92025.1 PAP_fibrillin [Chamaesiphon minutus PCC 6605]